MIVLFLKARVLEQPLNDSSLGNSEECLDKKSPYSATYTYTINAFLRKCWNSIKANIWPSVYETF